MRKGVVMSRKSHYTYTVRRVRRRGKQDGRGFKWKFWPFVKDPCEVDPSVDQQEPAAYVQELLDSMQGNVAIVKEEWEIRDKVLKKNCDNAQDNYIQLKESLDKNTREHQEVADAYKTAKEHFDTFPVPHLSPPVYWSIFVIISLAELFFNYTVFSVLGQSRLETFMVAGGLILAMPIFSHFPGRYLAEEKKDTIKTALCCVAIAVVLAGIVGIAALRESFFEAAKTAELMGISLSAGKMMTIFIIFNIVLYSALFLIAYESGHKNLSEYKKAKRALTEAEKRLKKEAGDVEGDLRRLADARIAWNVAHTERSGTFKEIQRKIEVEIAHWIDGIGTYEAANMFARKVKAPPVSFRKNRSVDSFFPPDMQVIECKCRYDEFE